MENDTAVPPLIHNEPLVSLEEIQRLFHVNFRHYDNLNTFCPWCENKVTSTSRSCSVSRTGLFHCHSCGAAGTALEFAAATNNGPSTHTSTTPHSATPNTVGIGGGIGSISDVLVQSCCKALQENDYLLDYLHTSRGLTLATIETYQIGCDEYRLTIPVFVAALLTIPAHSMSTTCSSTYNVVQIRRYLPNAKNTPKMVSHVGGSGAPHIFPAIQPHTSSTPSTEFPYLILCEGEWDCLLLRQHGFDAYTITSGVETWNDTFTKAFQSYATLCGYCGIVLLYDVNDKDRVGQRTARSRAILLSADTECSLPAYAVDLPLPPKYVGGDVTNWFVDEKRTADDLKSVIVNSVAAYKATNSAVMGSTRITSNTNINVEDTTTEHPPQQPTHLTLNAAADAEYTYKPLLLRCTVAGRTSSPYIVPKHVIVEYNTDDGPQVIEKDFHATDATFLCMMKVDVIKQRAFIKQSCGLTSSTHCKITIVKSINVEELFLVPAIDQLGHASDNNTLRVAYYLGMGLETNAAYIFEGITVPDPRTQLVTHILTSATRCRSSIDNFSLSSRQVALLHKTFGVTHTTAPSLGSDDATYYDCDADSCESIEEAIASGPKATTDGAIENTSDISDTTKNHTPIRGKCGKSVHVNGIQEKMEHIALCMSDHVTHIYGRADLHTAVDLVYHSPLTYCVEGVEQRKGWLEAIIMGDTRTGKGTVAEKLAQYYNVGELVSGENMTFAGLVATVQKIGDKWTLTWGKLPINDRRLVILDEASSLSKSDISKLSRIRSEGIAEVTKAVSERTMSRTRILWIANPRPDDGRLTRISDYPYGIETISEMVGAAEDVARFDFALIIDRNDVDSDIINTPRNLPPNTATDPRDNSNNPYRRGMCELLITWAWSRQPEQVLLDASVLPYAMKAAQALGERFSARIPLIQSEDVRFKLIRIACAVAARTFSTADGITLNVTAEHVKFAYNFLYSIYDKPASGYLQLSDVDHDRSTLRNESAVLSALKLVGASLPDLIDGLLDHNIISANDLQDYGGIDFYAAKNVISALVRERALGKSGINYVKRPAFTMYLRTLKQQYTTEEEYPNDEG